MNRISGRMSNFKPEIKKMKNPFKKSGIMDTVVNVGIGGVANAVVDYAVEQLELGYSDTVINAAKIAGGAILGSMSKDKTIHAATDGIAVVGVSNLVKSAIDGTISDDTTETTETAETTETTSGLPKGTVGRVLGNRNFIKSTKRKNVSGLGSAFGK